jgi:hypothetical protein
MNRPEHNNVKFFVGTEVEHTPAYGRKTLFVIGVQDYYEILRIVKDTWPLLDETQHIRHVYFGANQSFPPLAVNDGADWAPWERMIHSVLDEDILCTLDLDVACVEGLLQSGLTEHHNFIPMISVKLPYIRQFGYNATLKIDDRDFAATNPGVWCHSLHSLQKRSVFTDWSKYTQDEVING